MTLRSAGLTPRHSFPGTSSGSVKDTGTRPVWQSDVQVTPGDQDFYRHESPGLRTVKIMYFIYKRKILEDCYCPNDVRLRHWPNYFPVTEWWPKSKRT